MNVGNRIKEFRKQFNMTQSDLAKNCGISVSFVSDIETGRRNPSIDTLNTIAKVFNTPINTLIGDPLPELSNRNERDIQKDLQRTLDSLENSCEGLMFDGEPIDDETKELLKISLENSMRLAKQIAKQKFTPKKYRK